MKKKISEVYIKRMINLFLAVVMSLSLVGCAENTNGTNLGETQGDTTTTKPQDNITMPEVNSGTSQENNSLIPSTDSASVLKEGDCGKTATFKFYDNGVLVISGTGSIAQENPFNTYGDHVKYIRIEEGISAIEDDVFRGIDSFSIVELPKSIRTIGNRAFSVCTGLKMINFPNGLEHIGYSAFSYTGLEQIVIPGTVNTIDTEAFYGCESLALVILCDGINTVNDGNLGVSWNADRYCSRIIAIPDSVTTIKDDDFIDSTTVYCNEGSVAAEYFAGKYNVSVDVIVGYDGFVKDYDLP